MRRGRRAAAVTDPDTGAGESFDVAEVVLFQGKGAFAWRPRGPEDARYVRLIEAPFLWQLAEPEDVIHWREGARDLDGDGWDDLVLPGPEGYVLAVQRRAPDGVSFDVSAPSTRLASGRPGAPSP